MGKTNSLTSHHGESRNRRADKMGGKHLSTLLKGKSKKFIKHFYSKKRRELLKKIDNNKI